MQINFVLDIFRSCIYVYAWIIFDNDMVEIFINIFTDEILNAVMRRSSRKSQGRGRDGINSNWRGREVANSKYSKSESHQRGSSKCDQLESICNEKGLDRSTEKDEKDKLECSQECKQYGRFASAETINVDNRRGRRANRRHTNTSYPRGNERSVRANWAPVRSNRVLYKGEEKKGEEKKDLERHNIYPGVETDLTVEDNMPFKDIDHQRDAESKWNSEENGRSKYEQTQTNISLSKKDKSYHFKKGRSKNPIYNRSRHPRGRAKSDLTSFEAFDPTKQQIARATNDTVLNSKTELSLKSDSYRLCSDHKEIAEMQLARSSETSGKVTSSEQIYTKGCRPKSKFNVRTHDQTNKETVLDRHENKQLKDIDKTFRLKDDQESKGVNMGLSPRNLFVNYRPERSANKLQTPTRYTRGRDKPVLIDWTPYQAKGNRDPDENTFPLIKKHSSNRIVEDTITFIFKETGKLSNTESKMNMNENECTQTRTLSSPKTTTLCLAKDCCENSDIRSDNNEGRSSTENCDLTPFETDSQSEQDIIHVTDRSVLDNAKELTFLSESYVLNTDGEETAQTLHAKRNSNVEKCLEQPSLNRQKSPYHPRGFRHSNRIQCLDKQVSNTYCKHKQDLLEVPQNEINGQEPQDSKDDSRFGISFLTKLRNRDPSDVLFTLTRFEEKLKRTLKSAESEQNLFEVLLSALSNAFTCESAPITVTLLFNILKDGRFFDTVVFYFIDLQQSIWNECTKTKSIVKAKRAISCMLQIMWSQITRNPSSTPVFSRVYTAMDQTTQVLASNIHQRDPILSKFQEYGDYKKEIEKELKKKIQANRPYKPPNDFRSIPVLPDANEVKGLVQPFLQKNKTEGEYSDVNHYLDVQFRLLREDFVAPLREGITEIIQASTNKSPRRKLSNIKLHNSVSIYAPVVSGNGFCYKAEITDFHRNRTFLKISKRLKYGSLVCLSTDDFNIILFATVVNNDNIESGKLELQFSDSLIKTSELVGHEFKMAESPVYFEAYKHVLKSLQSFHDTSFPFAQYIVYCENNVPPPSYLDDKTVFDLRPVVDQKSNVYQIGCTNMSRGLKETFTDVAEPAKNLYILRNETWPSCDLFHLDNSQMMAVKHALSREFAILQGPPGTGKTYVGLQIAKTLLHNQDKWNQENNEDGTVTSRPMMVVCYTNHALDQFMEGIVSFYRGSIVRVGGRCTNEALEKLTLKALKKTPTNSSVIRMKVLKEKAMTDVSEAAQALDVLAVKTEIYQRYLLRETHLNHVMNQRLSDSLRSGDRNASHLPLIYSWLQIKDIEYDIRRGLSDLNIDLQETDEFVDVDIENRAQIERVLDFIREGEKGEQFENLLESAQKELTLVIDGHLTEKINSYTKQINMLEDELQDLEMQRQARQFRIYVIEKKIKNIKGRIQRLRTDRKKEISISFALKKQIIKLISMKNIMTKDEMETVVCVWQLNIQQRWRLYRFWVHNLLEGLCAEIELRKPEFENLAMKFQEAQMQEEKEILKLSSVIGLTTTGAAKYQSVLREIKPRIVIVEEAAEVLEAHILTSLSKDCKHLILIGDHKQLRPNPAVYHLAKKFNLEISMFERMVKNGMAFRTLKHQHRMRPEIANIIRFIYPEIQDHPDVEKYGDVKGVTKNVLFINHGYEENSNEGLKSYCNEFEARYAAKLCSYLLLQGYNRREITVLTTYTGQLLEIQKCMPKAEFEGVKVTVVDNYQGEENEIVILSLVRSNAQSKIGFLKTENRICVALSRARSGFFVLGNFDHLSAHSELWRKLTIHMKQNGLFHNGISLYCQNHPQDGEIIANVISDFNKAPEGGCLKMCTFRLDCGHVCKRHCHILDSSHKKFKCMEKCTFSCEKGHPCSSLCFKKCPPCAVKIAKTVPQCGHTQNIPCHMDPGSFVCQVLPCPATLACGHACKQICGEEHTQQCEEKISFTSSCGHTKIIDCWKSANFKCPDPCNSLLECGHTCSGTCSSCLMGRFHEQCRMKCGRTLVCGHPCASVCTNCPPCELPCENRCVHSECKKTCSELCSPCKQKCEWKCKHYQCTRLCSEPCNRPPCYQPCDKNLECGHRCIGLCGEPCPEFCRICHKDNVTQILFGEEDEQNARFVHLEDCGHIVECKALDKYMNEKVDENSILFKGCPWCKTPIRRCVRYGSIINATLQDIESVKRVLMGDVSTNQRLLRELKDQLRTNQSELSSFRDKLHFRRSLDTMTDIKDIFNERLSKMIKTKDIYGQLLQTVLYRFERCQDIADIKNSVILKNDNLYKDASKEIAKYLSDVMLKLPSEHYIISEQEVIDIDLEIRRGKIFLKCQKVKSAISSFDIEKKTAVDTELLKVLDIVRKPERLTNKAIETVKKSFEKLKELTKIDGLAINEEERIEIIGALKLPKGHWFKCPNGK